MPVLFPGHISLAGGIALLDMIVQAGPVQSDIPGKTAVAGSEMIQFIQQFDGILHRCRAGIRPKVLGFILFHEPGKQNARILFPQRHLYIRISFIVLQQSIVLGRMLLDQIVFQHKGFQFRVGDNIFKPGNQGHHLVDHGPSAYIFPKI